MTINKRKAKLLKKAERLCKELCEVSREMQTLPYTEGAETAFTITGQDENGLLTFRFTDPESEREYQITPRYRTASEWMAARSAAGTNIPQIDGFNKGAA